MGHRPDIDWDSVEAEYREGLRTVIDIARRYGCSHTAINKRAAKYGWERDLNDAVRRATKSKLLREKVLAKKFPGIKDDAPSKTAKQAKAIVAEDSEVIEFNAAECAEVLRLHQEMCAQLRVQRRRLMTRYENIYQNDDDLCLASDLTAASSILERVSRIDGRIIENERRAYNIDDEPPPPTASDIRSAIDEAKAELARRRIPDTRDR